jgi:hypothetical protein
MPNLIYLSNCPVSVTQNDTFYDEAVFIFLPFTKMCSNHSIWTEIYKDIQIGKARETHTCTCVWEQKSLVGEK